MERVNELISGLTHGIGGLLAIAALVLLVVAANIYGSVWHVVGFSIFGAGLILLYFASSIYHLIPPYRERVRKIFQKLDHTMIYVLIASTYTPITLALPARGLSWTIFGIVWGLAVIGIIAKLTYGKARPWVSPIFYISMGWLIVIALPVLIKSFPPEGILWLSLGGLLYTTGIIFFVLETFFPRKKLFSFHNIFHIFVVGGSFSHFWFMLRYVLYI